MELNSKIYNSKKPLGKEEKISLLKNMVWEFEAEFGDRNDKLIRIYEERCSKHRETLLKLGHKRETLTERERKLRSEYEDPKDVYDKDRKDRKKFLLRGISPDLEAEVKYWKNIPPPGILKGLFSGK